MPINNDHDDDCAMQCEDLFAGLEKERELTAPNRCNDPLTNHAARMADPASCAWLDYLRSAIRNVFLDISADGRK